MNREELPNLMAEYESSHPVERYRAMGLNVWPLLRITACQALASGPRDPGTVGEVVRNAPLIGPVLQSLWNRLLWNRRRIENLRRLGNLRGELRQISSIDPLHSEPPDAEGRDVAILTVSNRRVPVGDAWYDIYSDPLVELLDALGLTHLTWEYGGLGRSPRHSKSAWIATRMACEVARHGPSLHEAPRPAWFSEFSNWASARWRRTLVGWRDLAEQIRLLRLRADVFERWLRSIRPRLLVSVCWYEPFVMAATMAAKRLGIQTVDLQHGITDSGHYAYSGWTRAPTGGYETIPSFFWTWGRESARDLAYNNLCFNRDHGILEGGNLWLNKWTEQSSPLTRAGALEDLVRAAGRVVLVTPNADQDFSVLVESIRRSPHDWLWLVRFHPAEVGKSPAMKAALGRSCHPGLHYDLANTLPLYSLLRVAGVHLTFGSTCALEALAFGVPTIVIQPSGRHAFRRHIEAGVMRYGSDTDSVLAGIDAYASSSPSEMCRRAGARVFAPTSAARETLGKLLSVPRHAGYER